MRILYTAAAAAFLSLTFAIPAQAAYPYCREIPNLLRQLKAADEETAPVATTSDLDASFMEAGYRYQFHYTEADGLTVTIKDLQRPDEPTAAAYDKDSDCVADATSDGAPSPDAQKTLDAALNVLDRLTNSMALRTVRAN